MPENGDELAGLDAGVDILDGDERARGGGEYLGEARELERNVHRGSSATGRSTAAPGWSEPVERLRPSAAVSAATTCARACVACSSCASCASVRGRGSSTGMGDPSEAGGPVTIGTMRSESRIASSTLFVIITVVT